MPRSAAWARRRRTPCAACRSIFRKRSDMSAAENLVMTPATVEFELDGRKVQALPGETILQAAERAGTEIPRLCYTPGYRPDGNCRACVVEIDGERTLGPSCCRAAMPGMKVQATSERAQKSQKMVVEMLLSDMPDEGYKWVGNDATRQHGELSEWAARLGEIGRAHV